MPQTTDRGVVESSEARRPRDRHPSHSQTFFLRSEFSGSGLESEAACGAAERGPSATGFALTGVHLSPLLRHLSGLSVVIGDRVRLNGNCLSERGFNYQIWAVVE